MSSSCESVSASTSLPRRALVLIPSYVASLLRYRLLRDTLRSIAASEVPEGGLTVLLSCQCCIRDAEGERREGEEAEKRDKRLVDDPNSDLAFLDANPLSASLSQNRLQQIFEEGKQIFEDAKGRGMEEKEKKGSVRLQCFEHEPVDEGAVLYGSVKPMSQFQHIRFLEQFVGENDIVFFSDDDDISLPRRFSRVVSLFNSNCDLRLVFHQIARFHSTLLYHPLEQLLRFAEEGKEEKRAVFPEYFQFVIRGSTLSFLLNNTLDLQGFHMQDVRFCEALIHQVETLNARETQQCNEPLLLFRKAAHKRYWSSTSC